MWLIKALGLASLKDLAGVISDMKDLIDSTILISIFIFMFIVGVAVLYEGISGIRTQNTNSFVQILSGCTLTVFPVLGLISYLKDRKKGHK